MKKIEVNIMELINTANQDKENFEKIVRYACKSIKMQRLVSLKRMNITGSTYDEIETLTSYSYEQLINRRDLFLSKLVRHVLKANDLSDKKVVNRFVRTNGEFAFSDALEVLEAVQTGFAQQMSRDISDKAYETFGDSPVENN